MQTLAEPGSFVPAEMPPTSAIALRFLFSYTRSMAFGFPTVERRQFVVTCKRCRRDMPSGVREFPFQSITVECPLCGELRRYLPSEVFLGKPHHLVAKQARSQVSAAAALVAKSALSQAERVADRDQKDWKQRKWYDLYFKADEAYDALDRFQSLYPSTSSPGWDTEEMLRESHDLMRVMRTVHRIALVFPQSLEVQALFDATAAFKNMEEATSKDRLSKVLDAVEGIRQKSLIDLSVLD